MIMKSLAPLFIAIAISLSLNCFAQNRLRSDSKIRNQKSTTDRIPDDDNTFVVSYHVEERINMKFGGRVVTYDVSNINLVPTNDLGHNNVRVVTPKFAKIKALEKQQSPPIPLTIPLIRKPTVTTEKLAEDSQKKYVNIDILSTYERVLEKGYKSVDMLKRVANARYFDGDLVIAAKWYMQLFATTTELEVEYFFRYARALTNIGQNEKAAEMMALFDKKSAK